MIAGFGLTVGRLVLSIGIDDVASTFRSSMRHTSGLSGMSTESTERDRRRVTTLRPLGCLRLAAPLVLAGCSHSPEYSIFGSYFPAWIFCTVGGLVLAAGARALIARTAIAEHLAAPVLLYVSMSVFIACVLWLVFYS